LYCFGLLFNQPFFQDRLCPSKENFWELLKHDLRPDVRCPAASKYRKDSNEHSVSSVLKHFGNNHKYVDLRFFA